MIFTSFKTEKCWITLENVNFLFSKNVLNVYVSGTVIVIRNIVLCTLGNIYHFGPYIIMERDS